MHQIQPGISGVDVPTLARSLRKPRTFLSIFLSGLTTILTFSALIPLISVIIMLLLNGASKLRLSMFWELPPSAFEEGGGFGNALVGTLVMVGIAGLISVPFGILAAVFLAELTEGATTPKWMRNIATTTRFCAKVLSGFPSILAGVFVYGAIVLLTGSFSAWAGGVALAILMLPTVMLTAEESIRMVPKKMKEASIGMGATTTQTLTRVTLPTAMPGMLTGVMLAVARAAGETAPLLFTALFSNYWLVTNGKLELNQETASLAVLIYNFSGKPYENMVEMAWSASLVLVLMVLVINLVGKSLSSRGPQR